MTLQIGADRRTVLKSIGATTLGAGILTGTASAGDAYGERRQDSFTWAQTDLYEMLEPEPHNQQDSEGNEQAHRPLWVIESMAGTGVPGSEHSPHPAPIPGIDHVVPLEEFSAQWHVHLVLDGEDPFVDRNGDGQPEPNFVNQDSSGTYLISADRIQNASGGIHIEETDVVFTCPVRPHNHSG